jgi:hypothetical protein
MAIQLDDLLVPSKDRNGLPKYSGYSWDDIALGEANVKKRRKGTRRFGV